MLAEGFDGGYATRGGERSVMVGRGVVDCGLRFDCLFL